jgi:RNA polymerase sigma-70 factor (ECF subfamily)
MPQRPTPPVPAQIAQGDDLVLRSVEGDREALAQLLEFIGPQVRSGLSIDSVWRSALDTDDVMQTTYMEVFLRVDRLEAQTVAGFRSWMTTIAQNNLRDAIRALGRVKRPDPRLRLENTTHELSSVDLLDRIGCISHTASRDAIAREAELLLKDALGRLPASYRAVVQAIDLDGRPVEEIAADLGRSTGAVYMLRARAHDRLRETLGPRSHMLGTHT